MSESDNNVAPITDLAGKWYHLFLLLLITTFLLIVLPGMANAFSGGINGCSGSSDSMTGCPTLGGMQQGFCVNCHSGGIEPMVALSGPSMVVPGSTNSYTLSITGGQQIAGGLDVAADAGTLIATDPGTRLQSGEITHNAPRHVDANGSVIFTFDWRAPESGQVVLFAAGNSVNQNGINSGDNAATATLTVVVQGEGQMLSADPGGPYEGVAGEAIVFDGSGSSAPNGDALTYMWDFGDGGVGMGVSPGHSYYMAGTYTVSLVVNDGRQDSERLTTTAVITAPAPPAAESPPVLFGSRADVRFAKLLWKNMKAYRLVGSKAVHAVPYAGTPPHGEILETLDGIFTIYRIRGFFRITGIKGALIVKKNYAGDGVSKEAVANNPDAYLDSVTVMFQRRNYDPDNQNWFWVKYGPDGEVLTNPGGVPLAGKIGKGMNTGCIACHSAAPGGDYVFIHDRYAK